MQFAEQQESTLDLSAGEGPPAMAGAPLRVSFEEPHPGGQQIEKPRLMALTGIMVGLIVFGVGWRALRTGKEAERVEAPAGASAGTAQGAPEDAAARPEQAAEAASAVEAELSSHDDAVQP